MKKAKSNAGTEPVTEVNSVKNKGFCVYIGVTIKGAVQHGTIFRNRKEADAVLAPLIGKYPDAAYLVVGHTELSDARKLIKTPSNTYYTANQRLMRALQGE